MEVIRISGYDYKEKLEISKNYLDKKARKATGLEMSPNALSRYLGSHVTELKKEYFIDFSKGRTNSGRSIRLMYGEDKPLTKESINDMNEGEKDNEKECI